MLEELPETLDETYERILRDITKANRGHAHRLLQCLTAAVRPLRVAELAEVLAVDFGTGACGGGTSKLNPDWRWDDQQQAVLSTCSSLISIVDENDYQVVQFSHFSVKEYLMSSRLIGSQADVSRFHIILEQAHTVFAKVCLGVLLRLDEQADWHNVKDSFPLARYAAKHWVDHVKFEHVSSHVREAMEDFFDPANPSFAAWSRLHDFDHGDFPLFMFSVTSNRRLAATPLYYAALCGFHDLAEHLIIKYPQQVNANGGYLVSPLVAALGGGHFKIAELLYEHGAVVDAQGHNKRTPVYGASGSGDLDIAQWLLERGANANAMDETDGWTPLHLATAYGYVDIARLLLQHKADKNARDNMGRIPLHEASGQGRVDVVRLLLEHGVDVNALNDSGQTPLHLASERGQTEVARLLLERGADVNARDKNCSTSLHLASGDGKLEVACLLVEYGADIEAVDDSGETPLQVVSVRQRDEFVKRLSECRILYPKSRDAS